MNEARLPAGLEAAAIRRSVESSGGNAMVLHRGDPDRGQLLLLINSRGKHHSIMERTLRPDGQYRWTPRDSPLGEDSDLSNFVQNRIRFDPDLWLIELDVPDVERFTADLSASG